MLALQGSSRKPLWISELFLSLHLSPLQVSALLTLAGLVSFSAVSSTQLKVTQSCPTLCNPRNSPWNSPGQNTGDGSCSLLQGIFPTQELNQGLLHCRRILYQLSYQGSPESNRVGLKFWLHCSLVSHINLGGDLTSLYLNFLFYELEIIKLTS